MKLQTHNFDVKMIQSLIIDRIEMKISRKEKQTELKSLGEFKKIATEIRFVGNKISWLKADWQKVLSDVHQFLERELTNRLEKGRKKKQTGETRMQKLQEYQNGKLSLADVMKELNISRATFFRYLDEAGQPDKEIERENQLAKIKNDIEVFQLLIRGQTNFSSKQIEQFEQGKMIVFQHLETAVKRRKNLSEGREKFNEKFETDPDFKAHMTKIRSQSAKNMCEIKTTDERRAAGRTGGIARKDKLDSTQRSEIATKASRSRKFYKKSPTT